jgi:hypothetical protein
MRYVNVVTGEIFDVPRYRAQQKLVMRRNTPRRTHRRTQLHVVLFNQFGAILFWLCLAAALLLNVSHN